MGNYEVDNRLAGTKTEKISCATFFHSRAHSNLARIFFRFSDFSIFSRSQQKQSPQPSNQLPSTLLVVWKSVKSGQNLCKNIFRAYDVQIVENSFGKEIMRDFFHSRAHFKFLLESSK